MLKVSFFLGRLALSLKVVVEKWLFIRNFSDFHKADLSALKDEKVLNIYINFLSTLIYV